MSAISEQAALLQREWDTRPRWAGIARHYSAQHVVRLRGRIAGEEHAVARRGASRLWDLLNRQDGVLALGAVTGSQAVQAASAGVQAIYRPGGQAADGNLAGRLAPVVVGAEAGVGGAPDAFELMKAMIEAGAAGVHFEDQLSSEKKCGHLGGKVLIPTGQHIKTLTAARLAADVCGVPTLVVARTDAHAATLLTSDVDERDRQFITGDRTAEGFYRVANGMAPCVARGLAYAPYSDLLWMETSTPDLAEAREFAEAIKAEYPDQMLAYNCSPSFNWRAHLDEATIARFQKELAAMGYRFQFITLAGFHALNYSMFDLAHGYARDDMTAYVRLQEAEFAAEPFGYTATKHQREAGTGYFDLVTQAVAPNAETLALAGSTESAQFR